MKVIFDLGMHNGNDTEFYLAKGFRVVAVDANPALCDLARSRFAKPVEQGQLVVLQKAISSSAGVPASFYVREVETEWSSLDQTIAERDGIRSTRIDVESISIGSMLAEYGVPYYLKCDLEGAESLMLTQLAAQAVKPPFISVEERMDAVELLVGCGYKRFQFVNQAYHRYFPCPNPPREGSYVGQPFKKGMSGLFGEELDPKGWVSADEVSRRLSAWYSLARKDVGWLRRKFWKKYGKYTRKTWLIDAGWADIHARLDA